MEYEDYDEWDEYRHHPTDRIPPHGGDGSDLLTVNVQWPTLRMPAKASGLPRRSTRLTAPKLGTTVTNPMDTDHMVA